MYELVVRQIMTSYRYAVEMFSKLGLRYLMVTEEGTGGLVGVVIKKRLVGYLEGVGEHGHREEE